MKKLLLATTALIGTAGLASAEIKITGQAEMGIVGGDVEIVGGFPAPAPGQSSVTQFHSDIEVKFTMSGTTDNGLTFGAVVDLDEPLAANAWDDGGSSVFISGAFGTLTLGDTDGALDWALQEVNFGAPDTINDDHTVHYGYNGNASLDATYDNQVLRWDYSAGSFGVAVSAEIDDSGIGDAVLGIGFKYTIDTASGGILLGLGYQQTDVNGNVAGGGRDVLGFSVAGKLGNGLSTALNYSKRDQDGWAQSQTHTAIGVSYNTGALTLHANYGVYEDFGGVNGQESKGFGLAAQYDLGGGAKVQFGFSDSDRNFGPLAAREPQIWSLGVAMAF